MENATIHKQLLQHIGIVDYTKHYTQEELLDIVKEQDYLNIECKVNDKIDCKKEVDIKEAEIPVIQTPSKYELEGEQYIDSDTLIKQQSEQPAKKRFYYVPTGALGEKVLESEHDVAVSTLNKKTQLPQQEIKFSPEYQIITKEALLSKWHNLSSYCQQTKRLKPSRLFKASNALWIDKSDFSANQPDKILSLEKNLLTAEVVRISSFANSQKCVLKANGKVLKTRQQNSRLLLEVDAHELSSLRLSCTP
jgi:hypothetical protein